MSFLTSLSPPNSTLWDTPDFYSNCPSPYFENAVRQAAASQNIEMPEPVPVVKRKKSSVVRPDEPEAVGNIRKQFYSFATYSPGFSLQMSYKDQAFVGKFVPGHVWMSNTAGPKKSKVMVIGKMPGRDESNKLRNFIGPSGKLLYDQLNSLSVDVSEWYVTNLVRFTPPDNFQGALPKPWIQACRPLLDIELSVVQPDYILCLGSEAAKEIMNVQVDKAYGSVLDYEYALDPTGETKKTAKVVVCIHPAFLLRKADKLAQLQLSLRQFSELINGKNPDVAENDLSHFVVDNEYQLNSLVDSIIAGKPEAISIDAEWQGRLPKDPGAFLRCYQFSWAHKHAVTVALTHPGGAPRFVGDPFKPFAKLFQGEHKPRLVGHNIKADIMWLRDPLLPHGVDLEALTMPPEDGEAGPHLTRVKGGFDTMLAAHSVKESPNAFGLEALGVFYLGVPRYDKVIDEYLEKGIPHGYMPDEVLYPYSAYDADLTLRLFHLFNGRWNGPNDHDCVKPGLVDSDPQFHLNSRKPFWIQMMSTLSFMEMEERGMTFDTVMCNEMREHFVAAKERVLSDLRKEAKWPDFNPNSINQKREFLFGEELNGKKKDANNQVVSVRPAGALSLYLTPLKTTTKPPMDWTRVVEGNLTASYSPSTAKDTLGIFAHTIPVVRNLLDIGFLGQALNTALRAASPGTMASLKDADDLDDDLEEDDSYLNRPRKGMMDYLCYDGAVHPLFFQTKETGRASAAKPNLMAVSKRRDKDYKRLLDNYFRPMRSLFVARPGYVLVESDFVGAELAMMAWLSGDAVMQDHVRRSNLPESDPDHFDIHSSFAVEVFRLNLPPIKSALEAAGKKQFRDAVKCVVAGSRLHTTGGLLRVEDVVGGDLPVDGHRLYTGPLKVVNHKAETPIVAVYNGGLKPCVRMTTDYGYQLDSSINHWYWVMGEDGDMVFKQAKNLKQGDRVAVRMQEGPFGNDIRFPQIDCEKASSFKDLAMPEVFDEDWAAFLGLHLAEGSAEPTTGAFQMTLAHEDDPEFVDQSKALLGRLFGDRLRTSLIPYEEYQDQTGFYLSSVKLCRWLHAHCPGDSHTKRIPEFVYSWPKHLIVSMLRWMFEGDGSAKRNGKGFDVNYSTASEELARGLQLLLSQLGILSNLSFETREGYDGVYWCVSLSSNEARARFCREVGFITKAKNSRCVNTAPYHLDTRRIPGQSARLRLLLPFTSAPAKWKCKECLRESNRVSLNRSRLKLILSGVVVSKLTDEARVAFQELTEIADWEVSFQEVESVADLGDQQVYDVQTTHEFDHLVSYNGLLTHQTIVFGCPYGRGTAALLMAVKEESGLSLTMEEGDAIKESIFARYKGLRNFFENCKDRVTRYGFLRDPLGGIRRFVTIDDRKNIEDAKREACNCKIQGGVARAMSMGLYYLRSYRKNIDPSLDYYIVNQIHDAAVVEVAVKDVDTVVKKVMPLCLSKATRFRPLDDDGRLVSDITCEFGLDTHVYERWGQDLTHADCDRLGLSREYGKAPKVKAA